MMKCLSNELLMVFILMKKQFENKKINCQMLLSNNIKKEKGKKENLFPNKTKER